MITTVLGLPGSGKSTYCQQKVRSCIREGISAKWRPEPTEDVPNFVKAGASQSQISQMVLTRFIMADRELLTVERLYRDSDYYTSLVIFGGTPLQNAAQIIRSTHLIYLRISPELQKERIIKRNRSIASFELRYCEQEWHDKAEKAFEMYPCAHKIIVEQK